DDLPAEIDAHGLAVAPDRRPLGARAGAAEPGDRGRSPRSLVAEVEGAEPHLAVADVQPDLHPAAGVETPVEDAPARARAEEAAEVARAHLRREAEAALGSGEAEAGEGQHQGPARERPRVVRAALDLVPGVAPPAVVAVAHRAHEGEPLGRVAGVD